MKLFVSLLQIFAKCFSAATAPAIEPDVVAKPSTLPPLPPYPRGGGLLDHSHAFP